MLRYIDFGEGKVPWLELNSPTNSAKPSIHLSPANGFPVGSYVSFLGQLNDRFHCTAMDCRGAWPGRKEPPKYFTMHDFADDLIRGIEHQHTEPVIGMGHSQGGLVTLLASIKRPDLFNKLVLIDPASLPYAWIDLIYPYVPKKLLFKLFPLMQGSNDRQSIWPSREAFHNRYRHHNTYKRFTDEAFADYTTYALQEHKHNMLQLTFMPAWESHIFSVVEFVWKYLNNTTVPTLFIRTEHSNIYSQKQFNHYNKKLGDHITPVELPDTYHLAPHESPKQVSELIINWL